MRRWECRRCLQHSSRCSHYRHHPGATCKSVCCEPATPRHTGVSQLSCHPHVLRLKWILSTLPAAPHSCHRQGPLLPLASPTASGLQCCKYSVPHPGGRARLSTKEGDAECVAVGTGALLPSREAFTAAAAGCCPPIGGCAAGGNRQLRRSCAQGSGLADFGGVTCGMGSLVVSMRAAVYTCKPLTHPRLSLTAPTYRDLLSRGAKSAASIRRRHAPTRMAPCRPPSRPRGPARPEQTGQMGLTATRGATAGKAPLHGVGVQRAAVRPGSGNAMSTVRTVHAAAAWQCF